VEIKLFSPDMALLQVWAPKVAETIHNLKGVVDERDGIENTISGPAVVFRINPSVASRAGFSPEEWPQMRQRCWAESLHPHRSSRTTAPILWGAFPRANRSRSKPCATRYWTSSTGRTATLGALATLQSYPAKPKFAAENLQRMVAVTARFEGVDLGTGIANVQKAVSDLHLPSGIRVEYGGTFKEQQNPFHDLMLVLMLAVLLVFVVLLFEFGTFAAPVAILSVRVALHLRCSVRVAGDAHDLQPFRPSWA